MTYDRVNWQNEPSENTPLSAENLNKMDSAIKTLSEMVVANPVEADTDELKKIGIEGTIYKIAGGHELVNSSGSTMTQRSKMAFLDTHLTDDSGNNTTKVQVTKEITTAQFLSETEEGLYFFTDMPDSVVTAEQVAYGSGNVKQALEEQPTDISDKFVLNTTGFNDLNGTVKAFYDRKTKKVWGGISSYTATSVISTSQVYCTVSSPYKPTSQITFIAMVRTNTNSMIPYFGTISTTGEIKQSATNNSMGLYGSFEYYL